MVLISFQIFQFNDDLNFIPNLSRLKLRMPQASNEIRFASKSNSYGF